MTNSDIGTDSASIFAPWVGHYLLDPDATSVELDTKAMWGMAKVHGTFKAVGGSGVIGADGSVGGTLVIDADSVNTGQAKRDKHLRSKDFFDTASNPTFAYTATSGTSAGSGAFTISGTFSANGQTHPLAVHATVTGEGERLEVTATADIDRRVWGMGWTKMGARTDNMIVVNAVFTRT